jgi:hypothetical protein
MNPGQLPLITTDGFEFYRKAIGSVFGPACLYGQVLRTRRNDRIVNVERRMVIGGAWTAAGAACLRRLFETEHLVHRTIESHGPTRLGYLGRRTTCHARWKEPLEDHLELLRCYHNFVRPHRALKFGRDFRTPAMQAGLTRRRLTFREIFSSAMHFCAPRKVTFVFFDSALLVNVDNSPLPVAA